MKELKRKNGLISGRIVDLLYEGLAASPVHRCNLFFIKEAAVPLPKVTTAILVTGMKGIKI